MYLEQLPSIIIGLSRWQALLSLLKVKPMEQTQTDALMFVGVGTQTSFEEHESRSFILQLVPGRSTSEIEIGIS